MGSLFIVGGPIGNLEDITLRALRILREVDLIFAEDTRVTRKLLSHFEIKTPLAFTHLRNESMAAEKILQVLLAGKSVALITDSGTPGISDPGAFIVAKVRELASEKKHFSPPFKIEAIPGPSALTAAISVAGLPFRRFLFIGFLPRKKGRAKIFQEIAAVVYPVIFFESPHQILKTLSAFQTFAPSKRIIICRELTKVHEEVIGGSPEELTEFLRRQPEKINGEFVVIVH
jgi:16S rRNA (cytidine1402-2'-O)-methyltransferase